MKNPVLFLLVMACLFAPVKGNCQHFQYTRTDGNMAILVVRAAIGEEILEQGDEIGVFDPGGTCAGAVVCEGEMPVGLAAWRDDPDTDFDEGFEEDDPLSFLFWDSDMEAELETEVEVIGDELLFRINGIARINLNAAGFPEPYLPVDNHDFGVAVVGESLEWGFQALNLGEIVLVISEAILENENFSVDIGEEGIRIAPGDSAEIAVIFEPVERGEHEAQLLLSVNADPQEISVDLSGQAILPARLSLGRLSIDFGDVATGENPYQVPFIGYDTLIVTNTGDLTLVLNGFYTSDPAIFALSEGFPDSLFIDPAEEDRIPLTFDPEEDREYVAYLYFFSNDPIASTVQVELTGEGVTPISVPDQDQPRYPGEFNLVAAYPNPFNSELTIYIRNSEMAETELSIFDCAGRLMMSETIRISLSKNSYVLDHSFFRSPGIYFLRVKTLDNMQMLKVCFVP